MSIKFEISCPYHGNMETLELPDAYGEDAFEGEVQCGADRNRRPLSIKIERHRQTTGPNSPVDIRLVKVERADKA